jgi:hypothetical protein
VAHFREAPRADRKTGSPSPFTASARACLIERLAWRKPTLRPLGAGVSTDTRRVSARPNINYTAAQPQGSKACGAYALAACLTAFNRQPQAAFDLDCAVAGTPVRRRTTISRGATQDVFGRQLYAITGLLDLAPHAGDAQFRPVRTSRRTARPRCGTRWRAGGIAVEASGRRRRPRVSSPGAPAREPLLHLGRGGAPAGARAAWPVAQGARLRRAAPRGAAAFPRGWPAAAGEQLPRKRVEEDCRRKDLLRVLAHWPREPARLRGEDPGHYLRRPALAAIENPGTVTLPKSQG